MHIRFILLGALLCGMNPVPADELWQLRAEKSKAARAETTASTYLLRDQAALRELLAQARPESSSDSAHLIQIPMPHGRLQTFSIVESSIMEAGLETRFPSLRSYKVYGVDDPYASGRVEITPQGFGGMIHTSLGRVFIDPHSMNGAEDVYVSRFGRRELAMSGFSCDVDSMDRERSPKLDFAPRTQNRVPGNLLTYRIAVSATEEYIAALSPVTAPEAIFTVINRVNEIYERDLGIRLLLVADNERLEEPSGSGVFSNFNGPALLSENQSWVDNRIGKSSYDIGHVFSTGGASNAFIGSVCNADRKAGGASGLSNPRGDPFIIDYVAHEIGHQFGSEHSFNGTEGSCGNGRNAGTAFEPGSGSTIMAYAGLCPVENIQFSSDATFHAGSIAEIHNFTSNVATCNGLLLNNNSDPTITPAPDHIIPAKTSFVLDNASAQDLEDANLLYQWDQMDTGSATSAINFGRDNGDNPIFRSYIPRPQSVRHFPALRTQLNGFYDRAEVLPCSSRDLNFRLTVRDGSSGQVTDDVRVSIDANSGPFRITSHETTSTINAADGLFELTWDVADTDQPPVDCKQVDIDLLTFSNDSYEQYSQHPLKTAVANNGTHQLSIVPENLSHPRARFRVKCSDNIFYDISNVDFEVVGTDSPPVNFSDTDETVFDNTNSAGLVANEPECGVGSSVTVVGGGSGGIAPGWLIMIVLIGLFRLPNHTAGKPA